MDKFKKLLMGNVRRRMHDLDWGARELSDATGISVSHLYKITTGILFPSTDYLEKIARAINLKPAELFQEAPWNSEKSFNQEEFLELITLFAALDDREKRSILDALRAQGRILSGSKNSDFKLNEKTHELKSRRS